MSGGVRAVSKGEGMGSGGMERRDAMFVEEGELRG